MELRQLRYFNALATDLSFTKAAKSLNVSQPPLSFQIAHLEEELGARLFDRTSRSVALTEAGRALLPHAKAILARIDEARGHVARVASGLEGRVQIGLAGSHFLGPFPKFINVFKQMRPKVEVALHEMKPADHLHALRDDRLDICLSRTPANDEQVSSALLWRDPVVAALPPGHRLARRNRISLADLRNEDFVFLQHDSSVFAKRLYDACVLEGFVPRIVQQVVEIPAALNLVAAGLGVTLVPASMALLRKDAVQLCTLAESQISISPAQVKVAADSADAEPATLAPAPANSAMLNGDVYALWRTKDDNPAVAEFRKSLLSWAHEHVFE
jgi:LysR family transcriptional regulator, benzoate and cis,cis-muconate-responsive activator of ben and cat genes